jgi:antitoxin PrlF
MGIASTISSKGQVTVPAEVRKRLGVKPGDRVEFALENGRTVFKPLRDEENPFEKWVGTAPRKFGSEEAIFDWIAEMRGNHGDEE